MSLSTFECIAAITRHSAGFADAARGNLTAPVEHCPGWAVADLVRHLTEVHWFWATVVDELASAPPEDLRSPPRPSDDALVDLFVTGAGRLVRVLRDADQAASCWTWAPRQQNVAFVTRHQVQEAAVHHWDAVHAAGGTWVVDPVVAADSVDEFLHFSVPSDGPEPLAGTFAIRASDTGDTWTLSDGDRPGAVRVSRGTTDAPTLEGTAAELILWLYGRVDLDTTTVPVELLTRFKGLGSTD
jgi:uncharacterized protein (TIGR03083 family)